MGFARPLHAHSYKGAGRRVAAERQDAARVPPGTRADVRAHDARSEARAAQRSVSAAGYRSQHRRSANAGLAALRALATRCLEGELRPNAVLAAWNRCSDFTAAPS